MLPSQILPAITRQKVKNIRTQQIGEVVALDSSMVHVLIGVKGTQDTRCWDTAECEPIPEEPRPFRVGDKVVTNTGVFTTVIWIRDNWVGVSATNDDDHCVWRTDNGGVRHVTPEEMIYFN